MINTNIAETNGFNINHIGWRYYNQIIKKAMEQEFSWSGLVISLSIAFFIVIASAYCLQFLYSSIENIQDKGLISENKIYYLENTNNYLQKQSLDLEEVRKISLVNLA